MEASGTQYKTSVYPSKSCNNVCTRKSRQTDPSNGKKLDTSRWCTMHYIIVSYDICAIAKCCLFCLFIASIDLKIICLRWCWCSIFNKSQLPLFASIAFPKGNLLFFLFHWFIYTCFMIVKTLCGCTIHFQFIICYAVFETWFTFQKFVVDCFRCLWTRFLQNKLIGMRHGYDLLLCTWKRFN